MRRFNRNPIHIALLLLAVLLFVRPEPARASIPTGTQVVLIFVGVGVIGAGVGITIYHFAHKPPSLTGCTALAGGSLTLQEESDHQTFVLTGDTEGIKPGERVRLTGRKRHKAGVSVLHVDALRKDYGSCPLPPA